MTPDPDLQAFLAELDLTPGAITMAIKRIALEKDVDRSPAANEAAAQPCKSCPWMAEHADVSNSDGWFSEPAKGRYWNEIRKGISFPCHRTYLPEAFITDTAASEGWCASPPQSKRRECGGGLALMFRELELRERLGSADAYFKARGPYGVPEEGFERLRQRRDGQACPPAVRNQEVEDGLAYDAIPWPVNGDEPAFIEPACDCAVCVHHDEVHESVILMTRDGQDVRIDRDMAGLVQWLWDQGARTIDSCQSMSDAIDRLWPEKRGLILAANSGAFEQMNYRHIVAGNLAFIRGVTHPAWDHLAAVIEELCADHEVARWGSGVHVAFPLEDIPRLLDRLAA